MIWKTSLGIKHRLAVLSLASYDLAGRWSGLRVCLSHTSHLLSVSSGTVKRSKKLLVWRSLSICRFNYNNYCAINICNSGMALFLITTSDITFYDICSHWNWNAAKFMPFSHWVPVQLVTKLRQNDTSVSVIIPVLLVDFKRWWKCIKCEHTTTNQLIIRHVRFSATMSGLFFLTPPAPSYLYR